MTWWHSWQSTNKYSRQVIWNLGIFLREVNIFSTQFWLGICREELVCDGLCYESEWRHLDWPLSRCITATWSFRAVLASRETEVPGTAPPYDTPHYRPVFVWAGRGHPWLPPYWPVHTQSNLIIWTLWCGLSYHPLLGVLCPRALSIAGDYGVHWGLASHSVCTPFLLCFYDSRRGCHLDEDFINWWSRGPATSSSQWELVCVTERWRV